MEEVWKDIAGYEGLYQVSNFGRVKKNFTNKILKLSVTTTGYLRITLVKNKKRKHYKVHRLVANAFIPNPENKTDVNHIDSNRKNNLLENLEWCTRKENMKHARINGRMSNYKIDTLDHHKIINEYLDTGKVVEIAEKYNVTRGIIFNILKKYDIPKQRNDYFKYKGFSDELLILLFRAGKTEDEICKFIGCAKQTLRKKKKELMEREKSNEFK